MAVHAVLMMVSFAALLPAGLLSARHKWLFVDAGLGGGLSPWWAVTHMALLVLGAATGLAGMLVALVAFGNSGRGFVMSTHQALGLVTIGDARQQRSLLQQQPLLTNMFPACCPGPAP